MEDPNGPTKAEAPPPVTVGGLRLLPSTDVSGYVESCYFNISQSRPIAGGGEAPGGSTERAKKKKEEDKANLTLNTTHQFTRTNTKHSVNVRQNDIASQIFQTAPRFKARRD